MIIYALNKISNMNIAIEEKIKTTDSNLNTTVNKSIEKLPQKHSTYKQYGKFTFDLEENLGMPEMISSLKSLYLITCLLHTRYFLISFIFSTLLCLIYFYFFLLINFFKKKDNHYQYIEKYKKYTEAITTISFIIFCVILYLYPLINSFINYLPLFLILVNILSIDEALKQDHQPKTSDALKQDHQPKTSDALKKKKDEGLKGIHPLIFLLVVTIYFIVFILIFSIFDAGKRAIGFQDPERMKKLEEEKKKFIETEIEKNKLFKHIESIWLGKEIHIKSKYFLALLFYLRAIFFSFFIYSILFVLFFLFLKEKKFLEIALLLALIINFICNWFLSILNSNLNWVISLYLFFIFFLIYEAPNKPVDKKPAYKKKENIQIMTLFFLFIFIFTILPLFKSFRENLFIFDY